MLEKFKPSYNALLGPLARALISAGVSPNHITLAGVFLFACAGFAGAYGHWYSALGLVIAGGTMDGLDGLVARESGKKSTFGAVLDSSCDRMTEFFILLGILIFYTQEHIQGNWGIILCFTGMSGSVIVSYVKARCEGAGVPCKGGILQRPERLILLGIGLLAGPYAMFWILLALTIFSFFTVAQRLYIASEYCRTTQKN